MQDTKTIVAAIILAAGSGKRMGGAVPKQLIEIAGKPVLQYTLEKFQACRDIDLIYVVLPPVLAGKYSRIIATDWGIKKLAKVVEGGAERHTSVLAGLQELDDRVDIAMIHDGVRPFVSMRILQDSIKAAQDHGAVVVGLSPKDTVKRIAGNFVRETIDRDQLLLAQTPQTFRKELIIEANQRASRENFFSTDDVALVERMGHEVVVVQGDWRNIKITSPEDLVIAKAFLQEEQCA